VPVAEPELPEERLKSRYVAEPKAVARPKAVAEMSLAAQPRPRPSRKALVRKAFPGATILRPSIIFGPGVAIGADADPR
jgi:hypothetical protein